MAKEKEYLVQPKMYGDRKADYKKGEKINLKWKAISSKDANKATPHGLMGNVGSEIAVDVKTKKVSFSDKPYFDLDREKFAGLYESISAALAMYRVICMINNPIVETEGANGYKVPWSIKLKHEKTGEIFMVSEWKGAFGIWTRFHKSEEMPKDFKNDIIELLNLMLSDRSPHPYDDCTAGIVA